MTCTLQIVGQDDEVIDTMTFVELTEYLQQTLGLSGGKLWFLGREVSMDSDELMAEGGVYTYSRPARKLEDN